MRPLIFSRLPVLAVLAAALMALPAAAANAATPDPNESCLMCHTDPSAKGSTGKSIAVDAKAFTASVHGQMQFKCTDCHSDVSVDKLPHAPTLKPAARPRPGGRTSTPLPPH
jgi:hypothetical protein